MCGHLNSATSQIQSRIPPRRNDHRLLALVLRWGSITLVSFFLAGCILLALAFHKSSPPPVVSSENNSDSYGQAAVVTLSPSSKTIRVTEGAINGFLRQQLAAKTASSGDRGEGSVQDFRVNLRGDKMRIYIAFMAGGREMTFDVEGKLTSKHGLIQFDPDEFSPN